MKKIKSSEKIVSEQMKINESNDKKWKEWKKWHSP